MRFNWRFSKDYVVTSWGQWLAEHPEWLKPLTPATLYLELLSPLAILLSKGWLRVAVLAVLALFHIALAACFTIGLFPYVCLVAYTAFLPAKFWAAVLKDSAASETKIVSATENARCAAGLQADVSGVGDIGIALVLRNRCHPQLADAGSRAKSGESVSLAAKLEDVHKYPRSSRRLVRLSRPVRRRT